MNNSFDEFKNSLAKLGAACGETMKAFSRWYGSLSKSVKENLKIIAKPNSRIKHLALYGKKRRVRKKNIKRLLRGA